MFDVGFTEILMIGLVALVVIGPERLPDVARQAGKWIGKLQRFVTGVKRDIASELETGDLKKLLGEQKEQLDELRKVVNTTRRDLETGTRDVVSGARKKLAELESSATREAQASDLPAAEVETGPTAPVSLAKPAAADAPLASPEPLATPSPTPPPAQVSVPHESAEPISPPVSASPESMSSGPESPEPVPAGSESPGPEPSATRTGSDRP